MYNSKNKKYPKNYEYWSSLVSEIPSSSPGVRWCGEFEGDGGGRGRGGGCVMEDGPPLHICSK